MGSWEVQPALVIVPMEVVESGEGIREWIHDRLMQCCGLEVSFVLGGPLAGIAEVARGETTVEEYQQGKSIDPAFGFWCPEHYLDEIMPSLANKRLLPDSPRPDPAVTGGDTAAGERPRIRAYLSSETFHPDPEDSMAPVEGFLRLFDEYSDYRFTNILLPDGDGRQDVPWMGMRWLLLEHIHHYAAIGYFEWET